MRRGAETCMMMPGAQKLEKYEQLSHLATAFPRTYTYLAFSTPKENQWLCCTGCYTCIKLLLV
ncbi:unnamed protein product [Gulo gulo]|uniref:Uncharacterized protein n=1 Tax=Gulo gulo TaxID=48420 RepID=A0A9X9QA27_GULGU|nr:unnamed protein product [Gulo gulo]